jgi:hypothetical protein
MDAEAHEQGDSVQVRPVRLPAPPWATRRKFNQGESMKELLRAASHEIQSLRRRNELLEAQMGVVEIFRTALLGPATQRGMAPDVVWALEKEIKKLDEAAPPSSV